MRRVLRKRKILIYKKPTIPFNAKKPPPHRLKEAATGNKRSVSCTNNPTTAL